jgi:8-oxo-dGTP pyrophosphatase MutT (NUDIX family)
MAVTEPAALPVHRAVVRALLTDLDGRILIVKPCGTNKRWWHLPGGKIETTESPRAACRREVAEELGIDVEIGQLLVSAWNPDPAIGNHDWLSYLFDCGRFDAATFDNRIVLDHSELADHYWASLGEAMTALEPGLTRLLVASRQGLHYVEYLPEHRRPSLALAGGSTRSQRSTR